MTPAQRAQLKATAREFVETLLAQDVCLSDVECTLVQQAARTLLAAQRAAVLEEVKKELDELIRQGPLEMDWKEVQAWLGRLIQEQRP